MFSLKAITPTYFAPAQIQTLDERGELQTHKFDVQFKRVTMDEVEAIHQQVDAGELSHDDLFQRVLVGWRGVSDAQDQPLPFNADSLADVLKVKGMRQAISRAFFDSLAPTADAWLVGASK